MSHIDFQEFLRQSLEDDKLTRGERQTLGSLIKDSKMTEQELGALRKQAFDLFEDRLSTGDDKTRLQWLEACIRMMIPISGEKRPYSEAQFSPDDQCAERIVELIEQCRRSLDICVFTITDNRLSRAIIAAHKRGVTVRVISDDDKSMDRGSDILELDGAGVKVRVDKTEHHMHHKFAIFDSDLLLTGSYNWTRSASLNNEENFVVVNDNHLLKRFEACFESLWKKFGGGL